MGYPTGNFADNVGSRRKLTIIGFGNPAAIWQKLPHRSWFSWRQLQLWFRMMCSRSSTGEQSSSCHPGWIWMRSLRCFVLFRHYDRPDKSPQIRCLFFDVITKRRIILRYIHQKYNIQSFCEEKTFPISNPLLLSSQENKNAFSASLST